MNSMMKRAAEYLKKQRDNKRWRRMVLAMAMVVALGTFGILMLPGEAITNKNMLLACPLQVHTHTEDCYDAEGTLICGQADCVIHTHDENCYDAEGELACTLPEIVEHTHDASCYDEEGNLTCTQEAVIAHTHSDSCYDEDGDLTCGQLETTVHQHEDACFREVNAQADDSGSAELLGDNETDETADAEAFNPLAALISLFSGDDADNGIAAQAETSYTVAVGGTVEITSSNGGDSDSWTSSNDTIATVVGSGTSATITGVSAGEVTISHKYKNKGWKTETFTVTVTASEETDEDATLTDTASGYTVTVRGNKTVLTEGVTLHVEDYAESETDYEEYYAALVDDLKTAASKDSITASDFDFLHMYHIYLTKEGVEGEYVPDGNVNLQVTITYDSAPTNWSKVNWVGHYKKSNDKVEQEPISDGSASSTGVKQIKVSGNSITFHIQSFSVFPIAALANDSGDENGDIDDSSNGDIETAFTAFDKLVSSAKNEWQIVSQQYEGNAQENKIANPADDPEVYVQKNVVPTDTENEFLVYLSVDKKMSLGEIFDSMGMVITSSNGYNPGDVGAVKGNYTYLYTTKEEAQEAGISSPNTYHPTIYVEKGEETLYTYVGTRYGSTPNCSNGSVLIRIPGLENQWYAIQSGITLKESNGIGSGGEFSLTLDLEKDSNHTFTGFSETDTIFKSVIDEMGDNIIFNGVVSCDGSYSYDNKTKTLTWSPVDNEVVIGDMDVSQGNYWENNVIQMVYRVKLDVTTTGFHSCADPTLNSDTSTYYPTNKQATLNYIESKHTTYNVDGSITEDTSNVESKNTTFPVPQIRGLLYNITAVKVDETNTPMDGTTFTLSGGGNTVAEQYVSDHASDMTIKTDSTGRISFTGLPYGTYTLTETGTKAGYKISSDSPWTIALCYTTNSNDLVADSTHMRYSGDGTGNDWEIVNIPNSKSLTLKKISADNAETGLSGAAFTLYKEDTGGEDTITVSGTEKKVTQIGDGPLTSDEDGIFYNSSLEVGTYYLIETKAPDGYQLATEPYTINVTGDHVTLTYGTNTITPTADEDGIYTVSIPNSTGRELPETGGSGTTLYTIVGGLLILAAAGVLYNHSKRRRGEA